MSRPSRATCDGADQFGDQVTVTAGGVLGRCLQHETDHITGIVYGDRLPSRTRKQLLARATTMESGYPDDWPMSPAR